MAITLAAALAGGQAAASIGSFVSGIFGNRRKRKEARRKRAAYQKLLGQQFASLQQARKAEAGEFLQMRQFQTEGFDIRQLQQQQAYDIQRERGLSEVGRTGLAGSGSGLQALGSMQQAYGLQQQGLGLQRRQSAFEMSMKEAASVRDLQATAFAMDATAAEQGIKSNYGQSLLDMYGGV